VRRRLVVRRRRPAAPALGYAALIPLVQAACLFAAVASIIPRAAGTHKIAFGPITAANIHLNLLLSLNVCSSVADENEIVTNETNETSRSVFLFAFARQ
jgi:hypothetical protein